MLPKLGGGGCHGLHVAKANRGAKAPKEGHTKGTTRVSQVQGKPSPIGRAGIATHTRKTQEVIRARLGRTLQR